MRYNITIPYQAHHDNAICITPLISVVSPGCFSVESLASLTLYPPPFALVVVVALLAKMVVVVVVVLLCVCATM